MKKTEDKKEKKTEDKKKEIKKEKFVFELKGFIPLFFQFEIEEEDVKKAFDIGLNNIKKLLISYPIKKLNASASIKRKNSARILHTKKL